MIHPAYFAPDLLLEAVKLNAGRNHGIYFIVVIRAVLQSLPQIPNTFLHRVSHIVQVGPSRVLHERFEPPSASTRRVEVLASQQTQQQSRQQSREFVAQPRCISALVPRIMVDVALVEKGSNTVNTDSTWWRFVMENVSDQNRLKHRILNHPTNH